VSPALFGIVQSAQIIIWVMVGGAATLMGPILGAVLISWLAAELGRQSAVNTPLLFGAILIVFVLLVPNGILPMLQRLGHWFVRPPAASRESSGAEPAQEQL
jgi:branched-chain amino acid transport system permease protein